MLVNNAAWPVRSAGLTLARPPAVLASGASRQERNARIFPGLSLPPGLAHDVVQVVRAAHRDHAAEDAESEDCAALGGIDRVAQRIEPLMQLGPERDAGGGGL